MVYTFYSGAHQRFNETLAKIGGLSLPLLAAAFLAIAAFSFSSYQSNGQQPYIPIKKPVAHASTASFATGSKPATQPAPTTMSSPAGTASPQTALSVQPLMSPSSSSGSVPLTGGMGGGSGSGTTTTSPTPTVVCSDLLSVTQICMACTPPLTLQPGQKALLSADGTCVAVN